MQQNPESTGRAPSSYGRASSGSLAGVVGLLAGLLIRLVALLVCLEVSGLAHALVDVSEVCGAATQHQQDADDCDDEAGHECPPGCPNCHCTHAAIALGAPCLQLSVTVLSFARVPTRVIRPVVLPPKSADLSRLDRPPRTVDLT